MNQDTDTIAGRLDITLRRDGDRVAEVAIRSSRPLQAPRIFAGKRVDEVIGLVPLMYNICATAQTVAAAACCEQALGMAADPARACARHVLVIMETAREHAWRILLDWPVWLDATPNTERLAEINRMQQRAAALLKPIVQPLDGSAGTLGDVMQAIESLWSELATLLQQAVFGCPPGQWLSIAGESDLLSWADDTDTVTARFVKRVHEKRLVRVGTLCRAALTGIAGGRVAAAFYRDRCRNLRGPTALARTAL